MQAACSGPSGFGKDAAVYPAQKKPQGELREGIRKALPPGKAAGILPQGSGWLGAEGRTPPWGSLLSAIPTVDREKNQQGPELRAALHVASCLRDSEPDHNLSAGPQAWSGPRISSDKPTGRQAEGCLWEQSLGVNFFL